MAFLVALRFVRISLADFIRTTLAIGKGVEAGAGVSANSNILRKNESGHVIGVAILFITFSLWQPAVSVSL
jgi:hypothetical protein